jgi:hypothetical protein
MQQKQICGVLLVGRANSAYVTTHINIDKII